MRKFRFGFLIILLFFLFSPTIHAASYKFEWENTIVEIPVGKPLSEYKNKPKAHLYKDGVILNDANIRYDQDGDWLYFLKDVDTSVTREYQVWYKAYENEKYIPGTCTGYKALIKFIVKDVTPPTINVINEKVVIRRGSNYDFSNNVIVTDDYAKDIKIDYITNFDANKVGDYQVDINAYDGKNYTNASFVISVIELAAPTISYLGPANGINVGLNGTVDLKKYFKAFDEVDGDLTNDILFPVIDSSVVSKNEYLVSVTNKAGIEVSKTFVVNVIDDVPPTLKVITPIVTLDYNTDLSKLDLLKYINITDNTDVDYNKVNIISDLKNEVGIYHVTYEYSDGQFFVTGSVEFNLLSKIKPTINVEIVNITIGDDVDLMDYITIVDPSDPLIYDSVEIDDSMVDYYNPGTYFASVYAINSSGLSQTKKMKIVVKGMEEKTAVTNDNNAYIIGGLIILGVGVLGAIIFKTYKKKKNGSI